MSARIRRLGPVVVADDESSLNWISPGVSRGHLERRNARRLVYGAPVEDDPVFVEQGQAERLAAGWTAYQTSSDYGTLMERLPEYYRRQVEDWIAEADASEGVPTDYAWRYNYVHERVDDGDLFEWPAQEQLAILPKDLQEQYGRADFSGVSGPCLTLDSGRVEDLANELRRRGFMVKRDEQLVAAACGYGD